MSWGQADLSEEKSAFVSFAALFIVAQLLFVIAGMGIPELARQYGSSLWPALLGFVGGSPIPTWKMTPVSGAATIYDLTASPQLDRDREGS